MQWIVDSYLLVFAGLLLTMGTLGDRFGRKRALQAGLAIFGAASLAVLAADSANQLIAIRAAMGVGAALIMPATLSIITNVFPREERGKAIGIWAGMAAIGIGLGPLFGGLLLEWFSWTSVFLVNVPVAAIAILAGVALVPESRDPRPGRFDLVGAGLSIAALVSLVYGVIEAPERGWTNPLILSSFAAAAVLIAAFVRWELHTPEPMLNLSFFRNPRFSVGSAAISIAFFSLFGSIFGAHAVPAGREGLQRTAGRGRDGAARLRSRDRRRIEHQAGGAARHHPRRHRRPGRHRRTARDDPRLDARDVVLAARAVVLRRSRCRSAGSWARRPTRSWAPCPRRRPASPRR